MASLNPRSHWGTRRGSTEFNPDNPYEAVSSTNVVGPMTAGAETGAYAPYGGNPVPGMLGQNDTGPVAGNMDVLNTSGQTNNDGGCPDGQTKDASGQCVPDDPTKTHPWAFQNYGKDFTAPTKPGFGEFGTGGPGGVGQFSGVPQQNYGTFGYNPYQGAPIESQGYGGFNAPIGAYDYQPFQGPTAEEARQDPGYEFRRTEGERALTNRAAAGGTLRGTNTMVDLMRYNQGMADQAYGNVYNRQLGEYQMGYGQGRQRNEDIYGRALGEYGTGIQAQQLGEQSGLRAQQANLMAQQQQYAQGAGAFDRDFRGQVASETDAMRRAQGEAQALEAQAGRQQYASAQNAMARERQYGQDYDRAMQEYGVGYGKFEADQRKKWDRLMQMGDIK